MLDPSEDTKCFRFTELSKDTLFNIDDLNVHYRHYLVESLLSKVSDLLFNEDWNVVQELFLCVFNGGLMKLIYRLSASTYK